MAKSRIKVQSLKIVDVTDVSDTEGEKLIYTVQLPSGKFMDVMRKPQTGLMYVMEHDDGQKAINEAGETVDSNEQEEAEALEAVTSLLQREKKSA